VQRIISKGQADTLLLGALGMVSGMATWALLRFAESSAYPCEFNSDERLIIRLLFERQWLS